MQIYYTWSIDQIKAYPLVTNKENVICNVGWRLTASNGVDGCSINGSIDIPIGALDNFIDYSDLTEEQVLQWVKDTMGAEIVQQYEDGARSQLEAVINPPIVTLPLPWVVTD